MTVVEGERAVGPPIDDQAATPPEPARPLVPEARPEPDAAEPAAGGAVAGPAVPSSDTAAVERPSGADERAEPPSDAAVEPSPGTDEVPEASPVEQEGLPEVSAEPDETSSAEPVDDASDTPAEAAAPAPLDAVADAPSDVATDVAADGPAPPPAEPATPLMSPPPDSTAPVAPRRWRRVLGALLLAVLLTVGGGIAGAWAALTFRPVPPPPPAPAPAPAPTGLLAAVDAVSPAVLRIQAGEPETGTAGTALVLTPTGDVVTNAHLVYGESTATLIHPDGHTSTAKVVAADDDADLAWLRIDGAQGLPVVHLAGPAAVRPGEDVVAIGNALNLDGAPSVTRGIVSAVGRSTPMLTDVIQTDAAISSGSSGGALVDRSGTVVGITTEALVGDPSVSVEDIAFAIPADRVVTVLRGMGLVLPS